MVGIFQMICIYIYIYIYIYIVERKYNILVQIILRLVPKGAIDNSVAFMYVMCWRRPAVEIAIENILSTTGIFF